MATMSDLMDKVSGALGDTADRVRDRIRPRRKRSMLAERWPLLALGAVLVAGMVTGIAFAIAHRRGMMDMDMNSQLDEMLVVGMTDDPVL